jgi:transglutaminase-like putative cysteine protease
MSGPVDYRVSHTTTYRYAEPVALCHNELRLTPRNRPGQTTLRSQLLVEPTPATLRTHVDYFGNTVTFLTLQEPHERLTITAKSQVAVDPPPAPAVAESPAWDAVAARLRGERAPELVAASELVFESPHVRVDDDVRRFAAASFPAGRALLPAVLELTHRIHEFTYDPEATTVATPVADVLHERRGVCQDFAHLELACLRALGLAARYVSGYIRTVPRTAKERLVGADASHAWVGVYVPGSGWVDVDPTNDVLALGDHVTLAWGRDYGDVPPVKGVVLGGGEHTMRVAVDVTPVA